MRPRSRCNAWFGLVASTVVTPFSEFSVDDFSLSDLFLDTKRLQQFNDFLVAFAVKEVLVGAGFLNRTIAVY
jgi:hypothetical protein